MTLMRNLYMQHANTWKYCWQPEAGVLGNETDEFINALEHLNGERRDLPPHTEDFWLKSCPAADTYGLAAHLVCTILDGTCANPGDYAGLYDAVRTRMVICDAVHDPEWVNLANRPAILRILDCTTAEIFNEQAKQPAY